jgi:hypothetical protein
MGGSSLLVAGVTSGRTDDTVASEWTAVVYQMCREVGGRVIGQREPPGPGRNYYQQSVVLPGGQRVRLLLNRWIRLVACQPQGNPGQLGLPFLDVPRPDLFELVGLYVVSREELEKAWSIDDLAELTPDELRDIEYHGAVRVGDVIYNWFD